MPLKIHITYEQLAKKYSHYADRICSEGCVYVVDNEFVLGSVKACGKILSLYPHKPMRHTCVFEYEPNHIDELVGNMRPKETYIPVLHFKQDIYSIPLDDYKMIQLLK